jgi:hypothetical protein
MGLLTSKKPPKKLPATKITARPKQRVDKRDKEQFPSVGKVAKRV